MLVAVPVATLVSAPAAQAATTVLDLKVVSARSEIHAPGGPVTKGQAITDFKFLINVDNTGTTEQRTPADGCSPASAGYPESCNWPSVAETPHASPIYTHGTSADLAGGLDLPDGRYLISVLADGYKIDGEHFTVPLPDASPNVTVAMQPNPLPDATVRAQVFLDNAVTNGTLDQGEPGLENFVGHINDTLGEISTDVYGNPLCTTYVDEDTVTHEIPFGSLDGDGVPEVDVIGGDCLSNADGLLTIPHMGSNRFTVFVTPPDGSAQRYVQTTTLEGNHDWDTWIMEGATGFDTEFALAGEAVPQPIFGFAPETKNGQPLNASATGSIKGTVVAINAYTPAKGGDFNYWKGVTGSKVKRPINKPWLALADLQANDQAVWVGQGNADGSFKIEGVPDGDYALSWWDEPQDHFINAVNVNVVGGQMVPMGKLPINGWWTEFSGFVFNDKNRNGVKDAGENGIPNFVLTMRKKENSLFDRGQNTAVTDANGYYFFESAYPLNEWTVMEAYSDSFYTTGITYQADNQPNPTTVKGSGVDVSTLNIIGLGGRMDWGVHAYAPSSNGSVDPRNGGIVGSISYDTTRNELDPQFAAVEDWQPGVSDIPVKLWATVDCGTTTAPCDANDTYEIDPATGAYAKGALLNEGISETWERPTGCTARDVDGNPLVHGVDEDSLVLDQETDGVCLSSPIQGVQFGPYPTDVGTPDANFGAAVDGNWGFGDYCVGGLDELTLECPSGNYQPLDAGGYLVDLEIPDDASGDPMYQVTREEDINIAHGDQFVPQVPPPACAGDLHTVDVAGFGADGPDAVDNPTFVDIGSSPFEGQDRPLCDTKLVELNQGKSVAPLFNLFTDVPIPSRLRGLVVDDINFATDKRKLGYGEVDGLQFVPVGIYDFANRLVTTLESDFNGVYDVLLPSSDHISCPTPSGMCANMYRFVANDPGIPGQLNPNWNPRYRSISTEFEALPGVIIPTDLAPTQVGVNLQVPNTGLSSGVTCLQSDTTPQLLRVSKPYVSGTGSFTIDGLGFGAHGPGSQVTLDGTTVLTTSAADWSDTHIEVSVPSGVTPGPHQLEITGDNGRTTVNGLTFHVLGSGYSPTVREVGPEAGRDFSTIQGALDASMGVGDDLVVVYPGTPDLENPRNNPRGAYYENLIMASPVKLQGVGPGGFRGNEYVPGSIIDGAAFGGDTELSTDWYTLLDSLTWDGNQFVNDGQVIYVLASENATTAPDTARKFTSSFKGAIDGFDLRGGDQQGLPPNLNELNNLQPTDLPPNITTQGGAVYANAYARHLRITNNVVQNNGAAYGTIRIGTPDLEGADTNQHNEDVTIADNRIVSNAGTNLAGGVGLFAGSDRYAVRDNDICGNFSLEYGGGLTVYGRSPNGTIQHNRIYFNNSNDEGGGIMIAGQLPADPTTLSPGTGPVDIHANQVQGNLANDDGGGIRFLMAGNAAMNVRDNMVVNNVSTHEGGGISLNDATNVRIQGNTVMNNLTTATAVTSNGFPAPAGLSTSLNSMLLQESLPPGSPGFSDPVLFNNIFYDNRAGTRAGITVTGIGLPGDASAIELWDLGAQDASGDLSPRNSIVQQDALVHSYTVDGSNLASDPLVAEEYDLSVSFATWRQHASFVDATLVAVEAPADQMGDYHLEAGSPAIDIGAGAQGAVTASNRDFDGQIRPFGGGYDAGADEFGSTLPPIDPPPPTVPALSYSTAGNAAPPGAGGTGDDSDVYRFDGTLHTRTEDLSAAPYGTSFPLGIPNVDGLSRVDANRFYVSFDAAALVLGIGAVRDEDVIYWNGSSWQMWFDGSAHGLAGGFLDLGAPFFDLDAISIVGSTLYFSTDNATVPPGAGGPGDDADIYRWNGAGSYTRVVDASAAPYNVPGAANVDGLVYVDPTHFSVSLASGTPGFGLGGVDPEDVVAFDTSAWSLFFDGTAVGLAGSSLQPDAISFDTGASPLAVAAPAQRLLFSTLRGARPPGVTGAAGAGAIYSWDGTGYSLVAGSNGFKLPRNANVDGFSQAGPDRFLVSFTRTVKVRKLGKVRSGDVLLWDGRAWKMWFDASKHGLGKRFKVGAASVRNYTLYFSLKNGALPRGVTGKGDRADIYRWDGRRRFTRVFDASKAGLSSSAVIDGISYVDKLLVYVSFAKASTTVPGVGVVQDEDVLVYRADVEAASSTPPDDDNNDDNGDNNGDNNSNNHGGGNNRHAVGSWQVVFDGTSYGLGGSSGLDMGAFDVP